MNKIIQWDTARRFEKHENHLRGNLRSNHYSSRLMKMEKQPNIIKMESLLNELSSAFSVREWERQREGERTLEIRTWKKKSQMYCLGTREESRSHYNHSKFSANYKSQALIHPVTVLWTIWSIPLCYMPSHEFSSIVGSKAEPIKAQ